MLARPAFGGYFRPNPRDRRRFLQLARRPDRPHPLRTRVCQHAAAFAVGGARRWFRHPARNFAQDFPALLHHQGPRARARAWGWPLCIACSRKPAAACTSIPNPATAPRSIFICPPPSATLDDVHLHLASLLISSDTYHMASDILEHELKSLPEAERARIIREALQ